MGLTIKPSKRFKLGVFVVAVELKIYEHRLSSLKPTYTIPSNLYFAKPNRLFKILKTGTFNN